MKQDKEPAQAPWSDHTPSHVIVEIGPCVQRTGQSDHGHDEQDERRERININQPQSAVMAPRASTCWMRATSETTTPIMVVRFTPCNKRTWVVVTLRTAASSGAPRKTAT